jgi:hypothetical protein
MQMAEKPLMEMPSMTPRQIITGVLGREKGVNGQ